MALWTPRVGPEHSAVMPYGVFALDLYLFDCGFVFLHPPGSHSNGVKDPIPKTLQNYCSRRPCS